MSSGAITANIEKERRIIMSEAARKEYKIDAIRKSLKNLNTIAYPRSVEEVFSLGIGFQYFIGSIYMEIAECRTTKQKGEFVRLALRQMDIKDKIVKLANANLNNVLRYFYENGGPVIETRVEEIDKGKQSFFDKLIINCLQQVDIVVEIALKGEMAASEVEKAINGYFVDLYTDLGKLVSSGQIKNAYAQLIEVRMNQPADNRAC